MLWLCLHFSNLPLEIFTRSNLKDTVNAQAVIENNTVVCSNTPAQQEGVISGVKLNKAHSLCDGLVLHTRKPHLETSALDELAQLIYDVSPAVNRFNDHALMIEIGSVIRLFGSVDNVITHLIANLKDRGFSPNYGLANTPKAAYAFAKYFINQKPCFDEEMQRLNHSSFRSLLAELPLNLLPDAQQHNFEQLGLHTIRDVMALPISAIGKRFGAGFLKYLGQLHGDIKDPQQSIATPHSFSYSAFFDPAVEHTDGLVFAMKRLLGELRLYLRKHQWQTQSIEWHLKNHEGKIDTLTIRQESPDFCDKRLLELSQLHLENLQLQSGVEQISLICNQFSSFKAQTEQLFEEKAEPLQDELFGKLETRLGKGSVRRLTSRTKHIPELTSKSVAYDEYDSSQDEYIDVLADVKRPTLLLPKPEPIKQTEQGLFAKGKGKLSIIEGPERIETPWYSHMVCRDYFTARNNQGEVYWIYHNRHTNEWFTHGIFA